MRQQKTFDQRDLFAETYVQQKCMFLVKDSGVCVDDIVYENFQAEMQAFVSGHLKCDTSATIQFCWNALNGT